jgi:GntR family transcriptional repressor for pyruvate dehydrogenase complex
MSSETISKFQAVLPRRLTEEIADQIERLILDNELAVGDALPPERELASQLHVSRNILREAFSMLAQKGLLEVRPGSGTYVARPSAEFLSDTLAFYVRFNPTAFLKLVEARRSLEVEIAGLAAERAAVTDCQSIMSYLEEMEQVIKRPEAYIEADIRFHEALAKAADNEILELLLKAIQGILRANIRVLAQHHPTAVEEAMAYHRRIAQAVQQHAPVEARLAMREHLDSVERGLREVEARHNAAAPDAPRY